MTDLHPEALTWTALLSKWIEFARAALAIPEDDEGERWRASVPSIITLQAVTFALAEIGEMPGQDRAVARDKAEILIARSAKELDEHWAGVPMPPALLELAGDAQSALERSAYAGVVELIWEGPGAMVMPELDSAIDPAQGGTVAVMMPGTIVMPGTPVAWWADRPALALTGCREHEPPGPRQVYRQLDEAGRFVRDLIAPLDALPPGMPLLVPLLDRGAAVGHFTMEADDWRRRQEAALAAEVIPVLEMEEGATG